MVSKLWRCCSSPPRFYAPASVPTHRRLADRSTVALKSPRPLEIPRTVWVRHRTECAAAKGNTHPEHSVRRFPGSDLKRGSPMNRILSNSRYQVFIAAMLLASVVSGCGGGEDPILGGPGIAVLAPTVTAETPADNAIGVATSTTTVTATFSEPMAAIVGGATFTLTCAAPCANATGTVALDATHTLATFTLTPATALAPLTRYNRHDCRGEKPCHPVSRWRAPSCGTSSRPAWWRTRRGPQVASTEPVTTNPGPDCRRADQRVNRRNLHQGYVPCNHHRGGYVHGDLYSALYFARRSRRRNSQLLPRQSDRALCACGSAYSGGYLHRHDQHRGDR